MGFIVRINNTPYQFVTTATETILQAALRQQVPLPWACGSGLCGTCMVQLHQGSVSYPQGAPLALFEEDADLGKALTCMAQATSDVILSVPEWEN